MIGKIKLQRVLGIYILEAGCGVKVVEKEEVEVVMVEGAASEAVKQIEEYLSKSGEELIKTCF
jgi:hypothetical protein